jgi:hypothetical protein
MSMLFDYALSTIVSRSGAIPRNDPHKDLTAGRICIVWALYIFLSSSHISSLLVVPCGCVGAFAVTSTEPLHLCNS